MITHNNEPAQPTQEYLPFTTPGHRRALRALFSHESDEWETPRSLFAILHREFRFTLDVCATTKNTKCPQHLSKDNDGLSADWGINVCWMNPPYSDWLHKAYQSSLRGATVVCLTFARTDTAAFHDAVSHATEIRFLRGRLRFSNAKNSAPAPSCLIIFRPTTTAAPQPVQLTFGVQATPGTIVVATIESTPTSPNRTLRPTGAEGS